MTNTEQHAVLTIALLAAFADGLKDDRERETLKRIAEQLAGPDDAPQLASVYQDVLLKRVELRDAAAELNDPAHRQLAYELAVCVCDADDERNDAERRFLDELKATLQLTSEQTVSVDREVAKLSTTIAPSSRAQSPAMAASSSLGATAPNVPETELEKTILNHSSVNGALELLPQSLASLAIIGLQMKLVYRVGKAFGYELDKGHIKELIATAGVGLTSQSVENIGRKLLGGLLGGIAGGLGRGLGSAAAGAAFSFATTYALGQLAKRYYASGRQMSPSVLRQTYEALLEQAKQLQPHYSNDIQARARNLDMREVMSMANAL